MVEKTTLKQPLAARIKLLRGEPGDPYDDSTLRQEIADWEDVLQGEVADRMDDIQDEVDEIPRFAIEVVQTLPTTNISTTTIYLVVNTQTQEQGNLYDEYINLTGTTAGWEKLGTVAADVDLTDYYKKTETYNKTEIDNKINTVDGFFDEINGEQLYEVTGVSIDTYHGQSPEWTVGDVVQLTATVTPANAIDKSVTWTSSDPSVIRIDVAAQDDLVTATVLAEGEATITCTTTRMSFTDSVTVACTSIYGLISRATDDGTASTTYPVGTLIDADTGKVVTTEIESHLTFRITSYSGVIVEDGVTKTGRPQLQSVRAYGPYQFGSAYTIDGTNWATSDLREYLNLYYLSNELPQELQTNIKTSIISTCPNGSSTPATTEDKLYIFSETEICGIGSGASYVEGVAQTYYSQSIPTPSDTAASIRIAYSGKAGEYNTAKPWWTRSAKQGSAETWNVLETGVSNDYTNTTISNVLYFRPAFNL
jgi:hypothetical protein